FGNAPQVVDIRDDLRRRFRFHQRRRAAAEKDRRHLARARFFAVKLHLAPIGRAPVPVLHPLAHMAVKVAIGALELAERPVDIEGEGGHSAFRQLTLLCKYVTSSVTYLRIKRVKSN